MVAEPTILIPLKAIVVPERQRKKKGDIDSLAKSIIKHGLINPIVVRRLNDTHYELVAGERRLLAHDQLRRKEIEARDFDTLSPTQARAIEIEENVRRKQFEWQEECLAILEYHRMQQAQDPNWTQAQTASELCMSSENAGRYIRVATHLEAEDEQIAASSGVNAAVNVLQRRDNRAADEEMYSFEESLVEEPKVTTSAAPLTTREPQDRSTRPGSKDIICGNALEFFESYDGRTFNFIHCDFPYGIRHDKTAQGGAKVHGAYDDTEDTFFELLDGLLANADNIMASSCHIMLWFHMKYYSRIMIAVEDFNEQQDGSLYQLQANPMPLIWYKNDNTGIIPDSSRGPRQVYETAILIRRGGRAVVKPVANVAAFPGRKGADNLHISQKPFEMLKHFFTMLVDGSSRVLDPTCGSGTALAVADSLGAEEVAGWEMNPDYCDRAITLLNKTRRSQENGNNGAEDSEEIDLGDLEV